MTTADAASPQHAATGESPEVVVAGYRVERLLRRPSPADAVYVAIDPKQERSVELRVLTTPDPDLRAHFEGRLVRAASIRHPHLPAVYDSGEASEGLYLVTAPLKGVTLAELAGQGGLPPLRAIRLLGGVADALDAVHREGLAHGDVRLENVIVNERQAHPYLVDFALIAEAAGSTPAMNAAGDVRAFAGAMYACLAGSGQQPGPASEVPRLDQFRDGTPAALGRLLAEAMSGADDGAPRSAGELMGEAARTLIAPPEPAPEPKPAPAPPPPARPREAQRTRERPAAAPEPAPEPSPEPRPAPAPPPPARPQRGAQARERRRLSLPSARVPWIAALAIVLVAGAAGYLLGRPAADDANAPSTASAGGVRVSLPEGWTQVLGVPRIRGLDLADPVAVATQDRRRALVAGRLRGLGGSVHPEAIARRVDPRPPRPRPVSLSRYEALRFAGLDAGSGRLTLFMVPTSSGTLAAACLPGAPAACERTAASLALSGAEASGVADGARFARRLERIVARLERRRSAASRSLRSARLSGAQARAGRELAGSYRAARSSLVRGEAPPAAETAERRLAASLSSVARAYARLARAAERRARAAFARARRSVRRSEAGLASMLRRV